MPGEKYHCSQPGIRDTALLITIPLALMLLVSKCIKVFLTLLVFQQWVGLGPAWLFHSFLTFSAVRIAVAGAVGYLLWRKIAAPRWRWAFPIPLLVAFFASKAVWGLIHGNLSDVFSSYTFRALFFELSFLAGTFARDIGFLCLYVTFISLLLLAVRRNLRRHATRASIMLTVMLLLLAGLELGYFLRTGQNGTSQTLYLFVKNVRSLGPLVAEALSLDTLAAILAGPLLFFACSCYLRSHALAPGRAWPVSTLLVPLGLGIYLVSPYAPRVADPSLGRFARGVFDGFVRDVVTNPCYQAKKRVLEEIRESGAPAWYSSNLALVGSTPKKLNVVIVFLETLRAKDTSLHRPALDTTPFLVELSRHAALVDHMYAVIPRTSSSWIAGLYGMYPISDIAGQPWVAAQVTNPGPRSLAEILRPHGYASAFFTSSYLNVDNEMDVVRNLRYDLVKWGGDFPGTESIDNSGVADHLLLEPISRWMAEQAAHSRPFLLTVVTTVGHWSYHTPKGWPRRAFKAAGGNKPLEGGLNCVSYADNFLRQLFARISAAGLADSTIFMVMGDHGQGFGEHRSVGVRTLHEECIHVPAIIYAPCFRNAPVVVHGPRQQIDLLPTLAELLGVRLSGGTLPGISLLKEVPADRPLYFSGSIDDSFLGVLRGTRKYVYNYDRGPLEIYDLAADPEEQRPQYRESTDRSLVPVVDELTLWRERSELSLYQAPPRR